MTEIDISKIKPGDTVTVRGTVFSISENNCVVYFRAIGGPYSVTIAYSEIVSHEPAPEPLKVGDVVTIDGSNRRYTLIGLHNARVWLLNEEFGSYRDAAEAQLRRVEQP
jgi:hypothetical protein